LDAERLPFAPNAFDAATCRIAPHHFPHVADFVREMARVVGPGGVVAVVDQLSGGDPQTARYTNAFERLRDPSHLWAYSEGDWRGFFRGADLTIEHFEAFDVEMNFMHWAEMQGCDAPTIDRLRAMLIQAPEPVAAWMKPRLDAHGHGTFVIRQFLLVGRKVAS
jgi:SAM-dependent methyltransferase